MINVIIIGLGSIGKRHLESILKFKQHLNIYLIDINFNNKTIQTLNSNFHKIYFFDKIKNFNIKFDLAIVSTNSDVRYRVTENLLSKNKIKVILLEKICFSHIQAYNKFEKQIKLHGIRAFINYPRSSWRSYSQIKNFLQHDKITSIEFRSSSWNLASNSLHFIHLFNYLTETNSIKLINEKVYNRYFLSKRKGFYEIKGYLLFKNEKDQRLFLSDTYQYANSIIIINTVNYVVQINERKGFYKIINKKNKNNVKKIFKVEFQSNLTHKFLNCIISNKNSLLPEFKICMDSDVIFLKSINKIVKNKFNVKNFIIT